jgi:hypothetical protein
MTLRLLASLLVIVALSECSKLETVAPTQPPPSGTITADEYAVLSALIDSVFVRSVATPIIVQDSTSSGTYEYVPDILQQLAQDVPVLRTETMLDFKTKNLTRTYVQEPLSIHPNCILSSASQTAYPWFVVSRVGFSTDGQQAIAYFGYLIGPRAGVGAYYVLDRENAKWKIIGSRIAWVT